jgi:threonine dehydratase
VPTPPAAVVVPVGNGALLGGIGMEILERSPATARVGVQSAGAPVMVESWHAGAIVECDRAETFADGLAARVAVPLAVDVLQRVASDMVLVSERELALAVGAFAAVDVRVEGSGAAGLAALARLEGLDGPVVVVVTGRNIDDELWQRACDEPESFPAER